MSPAATPPCCCCCCLSRRCRSAVFSTSAATGVPGNTPAGGGLDDLPTPPLTPPTPAAAASAAALASSAAAGCGAGAPCPCPCCCCCCALCCCCLASSACLMSYRISLANCTSSRQQRGTGCRIHRPRSGGQEASQQVVVVCCHIVSVYVTQEEVVTCTHPPTPTHTSNTQQETPTPTPTHLFVCHQYVLHLALVLLEQRSKAAHQLTHQRVALLWWGGGGGTCGYMCRVWTVKGVQDTQQSAHMVSVGVHKHTTTKAGAHDARSSTPTHRHCHTRNQLKPHVSQHHLCCSRLNSPSTHCCTHTAITPGPQTHNNNKRLITSTPQHTHLCQQPPQLHQHWDHLACTDKARTHIHTVHVSRARPQPPDLTSKTMHAPQFSQAYRLSGCGAGSRGMQSVHTHAHAPAPPGAAS